MLIKRKRIYIFSRQLKNYNTTFKRINRAGVVICGSTPCEICSIDFYLCRRRYTCQSIYKKFNHTWIYVV